MHSRTSSSFRVHVSRPQILKLESKMPPIIDTERFGPDNDVPGVWRPVTSSVDWCESNYVVSYYVAEFANSISNVALFIGGLFLIWTTYRLKMEKRFYVADVVMIVIGIGSFSFHATLRYGAQLLDELPMVYLGLIGFYIAIENQPKDRFRFLPAALWIIGIVYSIAHWHYRFIGMFYAACGILLGPAFFIPALYGLKCKVVRMAMLRTSLAFMFAITVWVLDRVFCAWIEHFYLHAWWHCGIALAGTLWISTMMFIRLHHVLKRPGIVIRYYLLVFPHVTIEEGPSDPELAGKC
ncbi:ceramidase [Catenaria anguillulae PL171]|uniref:Ceramidase n=1 Tax=Catenaria anguillulae PL171 TaxID=765915 RepID=A0A1Y2HGE6_9FUNG|nr:ceramidase [Catenaria anguillulae PL171]